MRRRGDAAGEHRLADIRAPEQDGGGADQALQRDLGLLAEARIAQQRPGRLRQRRRHGAVGECAAGQLGGEPARQGVGEDLPDRAFRQTVFDAEAADLVLDARQRRRDRPVAQAADQRVVQFAALDRGRDAGLHGAAEQVALQAAGDPVGEDRVLRQGFVEPGELGQLGAEPGGDHRGREGFEGEAGAELAQRGAEVALVVDQRHRRLAGERGQAGLERRLHRTGAGEAEPLGEHRGNARQGAGGDRGGHQADQRRPGLGQPLGLVVPRVERRLDGDPVDIRVAAKLPDPFQPGRSRKPVEGGVERTRLMVFDDEARAGDNLQAAAASISTCSISSL